MWAKARENFWLASPLRTHKERACARSCRVAGPRADHRGSFWRLGFRCGTNIFLERSGERRDPWSASSKVCAAATSLKSSIGGQAHGLATRPCETSLTLSLANREMAACSFPRTVTRAMRSKPLPRSNGNAFGSEVRRRSPRCAEIYTSGRWTLVTARSAR